mgnify:CR=1 FL=1
MMKGPLFYSKILLFGEYGIIEDSKGLSIPYNFFKGALKIPETPSEISKNSNSILFDFCNHLKQTKGLSRIYITLKIIICKSVIERIVFSL